MMINGKGKLSFKQCKELLKDCEFKSDCKSLAISTLVAMIEEYIKHGKIGLD